MDGAAGSIEPLLELAARQKAEGMADAPWPPHYRKMPDEPPRVQPSKAAAGKPKRRQPKFPLITIAQAAKQEDALAGLERWKARWPDAAALLQVDDVLVDAMRGRYKTWTRIRVNLRHVPEDKRPPQETPDPDYDPWVEWKIRSNSNGGVSSS
jgi:hypothetical protein